MELGDMIVGEFIEYKHNHNYHNIVCKVCGKERIISLDNLKRRGQTCTITTCKESYVNKKYLGKSFGDYIVIGMGDKNKIKIQCKICYKQHEVYECNLKDKKHNASTCGKEHYYNSYIGTIINNHEVLNYKDNYFILKCLECGTIKNIKYRALHNHYHNDCIKYLPSDKTKKVLMNRWHGITQRTNNPNCTCYNYYGGSRIDVNGHYEENNVRLITHKQQQSNKRNTTYFIGYTNNFKVVSNNSLEFSKKYKINRNVVSECIKDSSKTYKGWKFKQITKDEFDKIIQNKDIKKLVI